ncbi:CubicO group peptidase, beta-lactamase class C family [Aquimarina amphilecti]|uniref:CubicO group peptidase, beta-lactamase class C family n=1 Tax=Aquimarina amphilecti TaxID=1038014 RepID=A0A1H7WZM8_AQUAM|nr:serine hydrolase [Aquimarina amphilecti]SEM27062.1 CubicO group peptidase, beta-lactamase class C family [Aquimarina amphilecti]
MENQSISKNLLYQRKLKGYTQEELSDRTTVGIRTIQRIEKGEVTPHLQTIKLLATALEIKVEDLLPIENPKEEAIQQKWLLLLHATPFLGLMIPICNILLPVFLWIHKREDNKIYDVHGRAVINFQITMTILFLLSFISLVTIKGIGFFLFIAVIPFCFIVMIINIVSVLNSQKFYYPLSIPFLKKNKSIKNINFLIILISIGFIGCTDTKSKQIVRLDQSIITKDSLTSKVNQLVSDANVHGIAITLFDENQITYQKTFGYKNYEHKKQLTDSTNMYGASFSKAVFGVLIMKLVEENVIDLDTPLESYLPKKVYEYEPMTRWHDDFSSLKNDSLYHKITARMCLAHTTGFHNYRWFEPDHKLRVHFEPGSKYSYSGEGFIYLQVVIEKLLGKGLEEIAQEKIFKPLKMNNSSYQWNKKFENDFAHGHSKEGKLFKKDKDNEPRGGGTLETTTEDYSKFLEAVLQNKIITKSSWDEMFKSQIRIRTLAQFGPLSHKKSDINDAIQLGYGLGWGVLKSPYGIGAFKEGHGDGFQHYSILFPKAKKGIMIMTNSANGESIFKELLEVALGDIYTPWKWQNYVPYNHKKVSQKTNSTFVKNNEIL